MNENILSTQIQIQIQIYILQNLFTLVINGGKSIKDKDIGCTTRT